MRSIEIHGDRELTAALEQLPQRVQQRVLRPLLKAAGQRIADAERGQSPAASGLLKESLGVSPLRVYRGGSMLFLAVGVRRGFRRAMVATRRGAKFLGRRKSAQAEQSGSPVYDPAKYLHLVSRGRKAVRATSGKRLYDLRTGRSFGREVVAARPNPFIERAFDATAQAETNRFQQDAADALLHEAAGLLPKG